MIIQMATYSEKLLSEFARKEWDKAKAYLMKQFPSLSEMECEDIFQESFVILFYCCPLKLKMAKTSNPKPCKFGLRAYSFKK